MTTSGSVSQTVFTTRAVYDLAFRRCKLLPEVIGAEQLQAASDSLYLLLSELSNQGIQLWCVERLLLPFYEGQSDITMPDGTVDLVDHSYNFRTLTRLGGTVTSSAGGDVDFAFDDDFATKCTQTSINGNIRIDFASDTIVTTVGILPGTTATWSLVFERSDDAVTWTTVYTVGAYDYTDQTWAWFDINGNLAAPYFRVRETGGGTLSIRELYPANTPYAIPMARVSQDNYTYLANRAFEGRPTEFWFDRQRDNPVARFWPVCNRTYRYAQFEVWRQRYIQDVGSMTQTLDIPQRWFEAVIARLAARIASELPEVSEQREATLETKADRAMEIAMMAESDSSPMQIVPMIGAYTK